MRLNKLTLSAAVFARTGVMVSGAFCPLRCFVKRRSDASFLPCLVKPFEHPQQHGRHRGRLIVEEVGEAGHGCTEEQKVPVRHRAHPLVVCILGEVKNREGEVKLLWRCTKELHVEAVNCSGERVQRQLCIKMRSSVSSPNTCTCPGKVNLICGSSSQ